ncbi:hypothetical protein NFI96_020044, partial [Prochilodus magdalenae]
MNPIFLEHMIERVPRAPNQEKNGEAIEENSPFITREELESENIQLRQKLDQQALFTLPHSFFRKHVWMGALDDALQYIEELDASLQKTLMGSSNILGRFCVSDETIRQQVNDPMPQKFRQYSPKMRVILDCTEIRCESATSLTLHSETFSNYKNTTTFKGLLGVAPCGAVTFISSLFTGSISDKEITKKSGILELLELEDEIMADKGFVIEDMLAAK